MADLEQCSTFILFNMSCNWCGQVFMATIMNYLIWALWKKNHGLGKDEGFMWLSFCWICVTHFICFLQSTVCVDSLFYFYCVLVLGLLIFSSLHIFCSFLLSMFPTAWQPGPSRPYPNCSFITFLCCNDSIYHCLYYMKFLPCGLLKHSTERSKEEYDIQYNRFCTFILGIVISHFVFTYT